MAVQGDLKDMNLPSLVQVMCLERRSSALVLRHRDEKGIIFFDDGQVVHATVGSLVGEEAVYQMLGWTDGTFRVSNHMTPSRWTVTMPWSHLLLEGVRRIDEQSVGDMAGNSDEPGENMLSAAEIEQDNALENDLILLLSRFEHARAQMDAENGHRRPVLALQNLAEMVNRALALSEERLDTDVGAVSLAQVMDRISDRYPRMRLLQTRGSRLSAQMVSNLYNSWTGDSAGRQETLRQAALGLVAVVESYLELFTGHFRSSAMTDVWRETCGTFIAELTQVVERTQF
jgi:hypothetical protein